MSAGGHSIFNTPHGAVFSEDRKYRYLLWRRVEGGLFNVAADQRLLFLLINPSTADDRKNDPTLRRLIGFGEKFGYGTVVVANPFAYIETDVRRFLKLEQQGVDVIGPDNDIYIRFALCHCDGVVVGWSRFGRMRGRGDRLIKLIKEFGHVPQCLRVNSDGSPAHPLMLPNSCDMIAYAKEPQP